MKTHPAGDPPDPLGTTATTSGIVKWHRVEKGYGCIESSQTTPWDIWFHVSTVAGEGPHNLEPGQRVVVDYERANQDSFRYRAVHVRTSRLTSDNK